MAGIKQHDPLYAPRVAQLRSFYQRLNPEKVGDAEMLLQRFSFVDLVMALKKKFGETPPGWEEATQSGLYGYKA